jgi:hypothetical protein
MYYVRDEIELAVAEPYSLTRIEEDEKLVKYGGIEKHDKKNAEIMRVRFTRRRTAAGVAPSWLVAMPTESRPGKPTARQPVTR